MAEVVEFPDVAAVIVSFLRAEFTARGETAKVATKMPPTRPPRMVRIDVTGGSERNRITITPLIIIQAWADGEPEAYALCELARALVRSLPERDVVGMSVMDSPDSSMPVLFPDPDITTPRYQSTVQLNVCP